jgi:L-cysteine:1D-myo-inositol 2-amino-2-deoxy-alpha-D-glucopyranoside ligase
MSKSLGNLELVSRLRAQGVDPAAIRLAVLAHHYRSDWEWTPDGLVAAQARLARWQDAVSRNSGPDGASTLDAVRERLADDLDAPAALAAVDEWVERQVTAGGDDPAAPGLVARTANALLGVRL